MDSDQNGELQARPPCAVSTAFGRAEGISIHGRDRAVAKRKILRARNKALWMTNNRFLLPVSGFWFLVSRKGKGKTQVQIPGCTRNDKNGL
jgi:hypothetical protein